MTTSTPFGRGDRPNDGLPGQRSKVDLASWSDLLPFGVLDTDTRGVVDRANATICAWLGLGADQVAGTPIWELADTAQDVLQQQAADTRPGGEADAGSVQRFVGLRGGRFCQVASNPRVVDGTFAGIRWFLVDCTDWKTRNDDLAEREANWRQLLDKANDGFYVSDEKGVLTYANSALARVHGVDDPACLVGRSFVELTAKEDVDFARDRFSTFCRTGSFSPVRVKLRRPDGATATGEVRPGGLYRAGQLVGTFGVMRDVTIEQQHEMQLLDALTEAKEATSAKSAFLASMSHEIRTPMNGVIGMIELLLSTDLDAAQRDYAETVQRSAEALLDIVNDILDLSKIEAGKMALEPAPFDLQDTIDEVAALLAVKAHEKGIELVVKSNLDAHRCYVADAGRIRQIVFNLVGNAVKFTDRGHVLVSIDSRPTHENSREIVVSVKDTGTGIPADRLPHVFEVFVQAHTRSASKYGGTGLGLPICRSLATMMGGQIAASSAEGEGSEFRVTLPLPVASPGESPCAADCPGDLPGVRVLVVDDDAVSRQVLSEYLTRWGLRPSEAASAEEAFRVLAAARDSGEAVGLALLDHEMPDVDGEMLAHALRADERFADTVLVLLSGRRLLPDARRRMTSVGFAACTTKPVRMDHLKRTLAAVLGVVSSGASQGEHGGACRSVAAADALPPLGLRVLVAEDNPVNQKVALHLLRKLGCTVQLVANGREAVEMVRISTYDVVLMDCDMPVMDGFQATAAIRYWESASRHVPIVALTAHAMNGFSQKCLEAGMDGYLAKPVRLEGLHRMLRPFGDRGDIAGAPRNA